MTLARLQRSKCHQQIGSVKINMWHAYVLESFSLCQSRDVVLQFIYLLEDAVHYEQE